MKNGNKILLLLASAALLAACGNGEKSSEVTPTEEPSTSEASTSEASTSESMAGQSRGIAVDYAGNEHLLGVQVLSETYGGGYVYCPKIGETVYIVPSFEGAFELDYITLSNAPETHIAAEVGTSETHEFATYGPNKINLEGVRFAKFTMPEIAGSRYAIGLTVSIVSRAIETPNLKTVTLNVVNETTAITRDGEEITGDNIDAYFGEAGNHVAHVQAGSYVSFIIGGADLENYHDKTHSGGLVNDFKYSASGAALTNNTLEASINDWMKTTASFKLGEEDVEINVKFENNRN